MTKLKDCDGMYAHWCPGCEDKHYIPTDGEDRPNWTFDGNLDKPTFNPSVKITCKQTVKIDGKWTGEWVRDASGNLVDHCCHYFLHGGVLKFCGDSTHALAGRNVSLPDLPDGA